jgi:predicted lactoylglutathione lyase
MSRMLFVNLPVLDIERSVDFFTRLGFEFDTRFSDERATCMVVGAQAFVMLLARPFFASFTSKEVADAATSTEAVLAVSASSRKGVDLLVDRALELGGTFSNAPTDEGSMYGRSFFDLDGHAWEVLWMDPAAVG